MSLLYVCDAFDIPTVAEYICDIPPGKSDLAVTCQTLGSTDQLEFVCRVDNILRRNFSPYRVADYSVLWDSPFAYQVTMKLRPAELTDFIAC